jgi:3',5'-nucleoside bisphosphate phosphatase
MQPVISRPRVPADGAIDLQLHTIFSDGTWTPPQLLDYLVSEGFSLAAITDHERTDTAATLQRLARERQFPLVVAAEISALWSGEPTDVLCYGFDLEEGPLHELAADIARRQTENTRRVCAKLATVGIVLPQGECDELLTQPSSAQPQALINRLRQHGYGTGDPTAVDLIVDAGFYFETSDIAAVVEATHNSGGVCLIAHPGRGGDYLIYDAQLLDELRKEIPIDGLEVYYPAHSPEQIAKYRAYAETHHLLASSGSDSHGPERKPIKYRAEWSRALLERLGYQIQ